MYYEINETQARQAKGMWSFSDYVAGSETSVYRQRVDEAYALCEAVTEDRKEKALYYAGMYAKKLAENINKGFQIELMCPSVMISGAGNFPVRKKEKQNAARDRNFSDYNYIQRYLSKIRGLSNISSVIKSGDENALELLQSKIDSLETLQADMKGKNAYYRKHNTMRGYPGLSDEGAEVIDINIENAHPWEKQPYPSYELTNNNAKLKNAKQRLESLSRAKAKETVESETEFFKVIENAEIMRLQLIFEEKPSAEVRSILKSNGFVWSGKNMAWQRQLTSNARYGLERVIKELSTPPSA